MVVYSSVCTRSGGTVQEHMCLSVIVMASSDHFSAMPVPASAGALIATESS